jgi:hypothetical protein
MTRWSPSTHCWCGMQVLREEAAEVHEAYGKLTDSQRANY